jgi:hypothetical protein
MDERDNDFWDTFRTRWPDMSLANALIHEGAADAVIHEAMCAAREGTVPDIDPERVHQHPDTSTRWVPSGIGTGGAGMVIRRETEPGRE